MSQSADSELSMVLQRRFGAALTELKRMDQEMQEQASRGRIDPATGQPQLNLNLFAQMILDIARQAREVETSGMAVVTELAERGLIRIR